MDHADASIDHAVHVTVAAGSEAELAADALWQAGAVAIEERPLDEPGHVSEQVVLVAGVAPGGDTARLLAAVVNRWPVEVVAVDLEGVLDAWREHAQPVVVGERLVVRPPWVPSPAVPGRHEIAIDPGHAFGSGTHASTRLALTAIDRLIAGGEHLLDVGCGSGILSVAALVLGAEAAVGVDLDPDALAASRDNAERNGLIDDLTLTESLDEALGHGGARGYDLVVANMLLPDLVATAANTSAGLAPTGRLVLTGVLVDQRAEALDAFPRLGVAFEDSLDGWLVLGLTR